MKGFVRCSCWHSPQHLLRARLYDLVLRADLYAAAIKRLHRELCATQSFRQADSLMEDKVITLTPAGTWVAHVSKLRRSWSTHMCAYMWLCKICRLFRRVHCVDGTLRLHSTTGEFYKPNLESSRVYHC
jgi:hypothetical protein